MIKKKNSFFIDISGIWFYSYQLIESSADIFEIRSLKQNLEYA